MTAARARSLLIGTLIAAPFYLLLIDVTTTPELYAGVAAVVLAACTYELAYAEGVGDAAFSAAWFLRAGRVLREVMPQIWILCRAALEQLRAPQNERGVLRCAPFRVGDDDSRDIGRRAAAEALGSLAPNTIVIGIDTDHELLIVHQLQQCGGPEQLDPLGLG